MASGGVEGSNSSEEMLIRLESSTHVTNLTKKLQEQFLNKAMVDIALVTEEGQFIHAHKFILSAGSPYFKDIIDNASKLNPTHSSSCPLIICLSGMKYVHLYPLIKYLYTGSVDVSQNDLRILIKSAFQLKISGLYEEAEGIMQSSEAELTNDDSNSNDLGIETIFKEEQDEDTIDEDNEIDDEPFQHFLVETDIVEDHTQSSSADLSSVNRLSQRSFTSKKGRSLSNRFYNSSFNRKSNTNQPEKLLQCNNCGNVYRCNKSLWRHKKFNCPATESTKVTFVCKICAKGFSRSDNLKRHVMIAHQEKS